MEREQSVSRLQELAYRLRELNNQQLTSSMERFIIALENGDSEAVKGRVKNELFDKLTPPEQELINIFLFEGKGSPWYRFNKKD